MDTSKIIEDLANIAKEAAERNESLTSRAEALREQAERLDTKGHEIVGTAERRISGVITPMLVDAIEQGYPQFDRNKCYEQGGWSTKFNQSSTYLRIIIEDDGTVDINGGLYGTLGDVHGNKTLLSMRCEGNLAEILDSISNGKDERLRKQAERLVPCNYPEGYRYPTMRAVRAWLDKFDIVDRNSETYYGRDHEKLFVLAEPHKKVGYTVEESLIDRVQVYVNPNQRDNLRGIVGFTNKMNKIGEYLRTRDLLLRQEDVEQFETVFHLNMVKPRVG
jgi:hypothetical protein